METAFLIPKRHRGWPSPDDSWGLTPMFGEDGWCHACGTPLREQCGPLTLRRRGLAKADGAWMPNWQFDAVCLSQEVADRVRASLDVDLRPVAWAAGAGPSVWQLVIPATATAWFDPSELSAVAVARHGATGATCPQCGTWRWFPVPDEDLPPPRTGVDWSVTHAAASPEWFGSGASSFRQLLFSRALAEFLAAASPKDFQVHPVSDLPSN